MKRRTVLTLIISIAIMAATVLSTSASGSLPGSGWYTIETVQNVGTGAAQIAVTAYSGTDASTFSATAASVSQGAFYRFDPSQFSGMTAGFTGSGVVSSNEPVVALSQILNVQSGSYGLAGGKSLGDFQGINTPANILYFPGVKNNWFGQTTIFYIQNAGASSSQVQAVFTMGNGAVYTYTTPVAINPNQMVVVHPADAGVPSGPSNNLTRINNGSMQLTSLGSQPLAAIYVEYREGQAAASAISSMRGMASSDFGTKAYAPAIKNSWFGRFTGIGIQNAAGTPIVATVVYIGFQGACAGKTYTDTQTIDVGMSGNFLQYPTTGGVKYTNLPPACAASATISATGDYVALTGESNLTGYPAVSQAAYGIPDGSSTTKVALPLFHDNTLGWISGLLVQNVGSATATNVVATFSCNGNNNNPAFAFTATSKPLTLDVGASFLFYRPFSYAPVKAVMATPFQYDNSLCSAIVTADQKIVATGGESPSVGSTDGDMYVGFNLVP